MGEQSHWLAVNASGQTHPVADDGHVKPAVTLHNKTEEHVSLYVLYVTKKLIAKICYSNSKKAKNIYFTTRCASAFPIRICCWALTKTSNTS